MTCVIDSLFAGLTAEAHSQLGSAAGMHAALRQSGAPVAVRWQGQALSAQLLKELRDDVRSRPAPTNGYDCAALDPLLAAYAEVYSTKVVHNYLGQTFTYDPPAAAKRVVSLRSNAGHMALQSARAV